MCIIKTQKQRASHGGLFIIEKTIKIGTSYKKIPKEESGNKISTQKPA